MSLEELLTTHLPHDDEKQQHVCKRSSKTGRHKVKPVISPGGGCGQDQTGIDPKKQEV